MELSMHTSLWGLHGNGKGGFEDLGGHYQCMMTGFHVIIITHNPNPQMFTNKNKCTFDPMVQSIQMDANPRGPHYEVRGAVHGTEVYWVICMDC